MDRDWIGLTDAVFRSNGVLTYWRVYTLAMRRQIEARRDGKRWLVSAASLDRYVAMMSDFRRESV